MTPITDEIGKAVAEHRDAGKGDRMPTALDFGDDGGPMTARILSWQQGQGGRGGPRHQTGTVHDLQLARKARAAARTVSGMFIYAARL